MANIRDVGKGLLGWLPFLAIIAAAYKYYADRGLDGIINDLQAITFEGIKNKIQTIAIGFGLIVFAPMVSRYIPTTQLRKPVMAVMYYVGATQLFGALRSGAGSGRGYIRSAPVMRSVYQGR